MNRTLDSIKGIELFQTRYGYRFSIDAPLLSDFVRKIKPHHIADIGAGNGIIGILLAKKYPSSKVSVIEIQQSLYKLCTQNIEMNKVKTRVTPYNLDIGDMQSLKKSIAEHSYDVVVSNPPFRISRSGKISPCDEKAIARHEIKINLEKLIHGIDYLLKPKGSTYLIFHPERLVELFAGMRKNGIEPKRARFVHPDRNSESKMVLIEGVKTARASVKIEKPFFIYNKRNEYTDEVKKVLDPAQ